MKILSIALMCIAVAACGNPYAQMEQQAHQAAHYEAVTMCDQAERSVEWKDNCYKMVLTRRQQEFIGMVNQQQAAQAQRSAALFAAGAGIMAAPPPQPMPMPQPVNCTSRPVAGTVYTNCR